MRFGLDVAQQRMSWDELVRRVRFAEDLGFDGVWGFDHFQPMYGEGPGETFEGMTHAGRAGRAHDRIRLGLLVTGATYRHPSVLAAQALTIDHASHGRLELALGAAWFEKEHDELGIPFPPTAERFDLLEDTLEIVTRLFTGEVVSYEGQAGLAARRPDAPASGAAPAPADLDRRHGPATDAAAGRPLRRRLARLGHARTPCARPKRALDELAGRGGSGSVRHHAGRLAVARRPRRRPGGTRPNGATPGTATWSAAGRRRERRRWRPSPATPCPIARPRAAHSGRPA